ncbi:Immediate early protein ICP0 [Myxococcus landrumensis]|uniref:Immediate early protein ICP0 n=1 Tax=Myxococcus landrumensis TaxID=2813577 RepID=A0ABX7N1R3_9BACT|nr:Immediate early protein ICP0 [Myxococcus landrumus]QSQ12657.1 Immediate early protein ICP0 [Myxococcus landrumus]
MSTTSRIAAGFGQLARLLVHSGKGSLPPTGPKSSEGGLPPPRDGFRTQPSVPQQHPSLGGQERAPVRKVAELIPPGLEKVATRTELGQRFGSDAALLSAHLKPSQLPSTERATRLWTFFAAYAEAAAAQPPQKEAQAAFRDALKGQGFAELRDARTGQDGVTQGLWVLSARTPDEARERVASVRLEPPPEVLHSEAALRKEGTAEQAPASSQRGMEALRGGPSTPQARVADGQTTEVDEELPTDGARSRRTNRRLGPMMLWNVLHGFREGPEDGAVAQGQWDRVAFGAMLALAAIALIVVALVSL